MQYTDGCIFAALDSHAYIASMTIGKNLELAMAHAKFASQKALQEASAVPQGTISRVLNDKNAGTPDMDTLQKLADACQVPLQFLLYGPKEGDPPLPPYRPPPDLDKSLDQCVELISVFRTLPPEGRVLLLENAYSLVVSLSRKRREVGNNQP